MFADDALNKIFNNKDLEETMEQMRRMTAFAAIFNDPGKFNDICVDFLVANNGTAPLIGLAQNILKKTGLGEDRAAVEFMLKLLLQFNPDKFVSGSPFTVYNGNAVLNNIFSVTTTTATLMFGDKLLQENILDGEGDVIGAAEKRAVHNALRMLRNNPRLRHEMICSFLSNSSYDEEEAHKAYPKGGIDMFVALCLGDLTGNPEKDKDTWFAHQWEIGLHYGQDANKLMVVNDYLGFATTAWKSFTERFGKNGVCLMTKEGAVVNDSRPHKLLQILATAMNKLYASHSLFKPVPVPEYKPQAEQAKAETPAEDLQQACGCGACGWPIMMIEVPPVDQEFSELDAETLAKAERVYRSMIREALQNVESFITNNYHDYALGVNEILVNAAKMGLNEIFEDFDVQDLVEFIKYQNPASLDADHHDALLLASQMHAVVRFATM